MNCDVDGVAPRPRPLSGGLWTFLSWLRRDERDSSSESLSSAGSDRTAASFAFLTPAHYSVGNTTNVLPVIGPPTDSYKKRVQERNVRRQYERDLTLHRKYGLYRSEGGTGYDTFTLQQHRRPDGDSIGKWGRERRATSECLQRRVVHVPGKRRAPLPPTYPLTSSGSVTLARRTRKRPAPQPPSKITLKPKDITNLDYTTKAMSSKLNRSEQSVQSCESSVEYKSEKCVKKDTNRKDKKTRSETSFLKQLFENRKRASTTDTAIVKILPSISELDKQAAEIIENGKLKVKEKEHNIFGSERSNSVEQSLKTKDTFWFCTKCLKKYNISVKECYYCFPELKKTNMESVRNVTSQQTNEIYTQTDNGLASPSSSRNIKINEKQKLKEILKEMKDSLPKKSKHDNERVNINQNNTVSEKSIAQCPVVTETPTLRIGSDIDSIKRQPLFHEPSTSDIKTQPTVTKNPNVKLVELKEAANLSNVQYLDGHAKATKMLIKLPLNKETHDKNTKNVKVDKNSDVSNSSEKRDLHTPLRISSLLNPVYIPKHKESSKQFPADILPTKDSSSVIKTSIINKSDAVVPTMVKVESVSCNATRKSGLTTQVQSLNTNIQKLKVENIEPITVQPKLTTLKDKIKENDVDLNAQPKVTILSNNKVPPIKVVALKPEAIKSICSENNKIDSPLASLPSTSANIDNTPLLLSNIEKVNQHARRRELVNQLEKSIAKGDEHAAADAAAKLAQLRLSCSVLSFSSQIVTEPFSLSSCNTSPNAYSTTQMPAGTLMNSVNTFKNKDTNETVQVPTTTTEKEIIQSQQKTKNILLDKVVTCNVLDQSVKQGQSISTARNEFTNGKPVIKKDVISQSALPSGSKTPKESKEKCDVSIQVWVEDKEATRGPINLNTQRRALMGELRIQAEALLGIPTRLQRWIIGRTLCTEDNTPIATIAGPELNAPFYLCLVEPGQSDGNRASTTNVHDREKENAVKETVQKIEKSLKQESIKEIGQDKVEAIVQDTVKIIMKNENEAANVYKELVKLEQQALVPNAESFECGVCMDECPPDRGVILRECVHMFCRGCLSDLVRHCEDPAVLCPSMGCRGALQEREVRALVTAEDYERWLARGLAAAESGTRNAFHCRTRDCNGWALCDPGVQKFPCPVCKHTNCVLCQAIHEGETCDDYRTKLQCVADAGPDQVDGSTRALIDTLIKKGEALECPECKAVITKKWGCDWVKCSACKTEICWVTRGRRWGPAGRGDTSSGCRCGVDGKKCHPSCGYCH